MTENELPSPATLWEKHKADLRVRVRSWLDKPSLEVSPKWPNKEQADAAVEQLLAFVIALPPALPFGVRRGNYLATKDTDLLKALAAAEKALTATLDKSPPAKHLHARRQLVNLRKQIQLARGIPPSSVRRATGRPPVAWKHDLWMSAGDPATGSLIVRVWADRVYCILDKVMGEPRLSRGKDPKSVVAHVTACLVRFKYPDAPATAASVAGLLDDTSFPSLNR